MYTRTHDDGGKAGQNEVHLRQRTVHGCSQSIRAGRPIHYPCFECMETQSNIVASYLSGLVANSNSESTAAMIDDNIDNPTMPIRTPSDSGSILLWSR